MQSVANVAHSNAKDITLITIFHRVTKGCVPMQNALDDLIEEYYSSRKQLRETRKKLDRESSLNREDIRILNSMMKDMNDDIDMMEAYKTHTRNGKGR